MRFLKEDFGDSYEIDEFIDLLNNRYKTYFEVRLKRNGREQYRYFRDKNSAKQYYDKLKEEMETDSYYESSEIELSKVELTENKDTIEDFDTYSIDYDI